MPEHYGQVRPAGSEDIASWLGLAREVQPIFGPMPDLSVHIARGIARGIAFVIPDLLPGAPGVAAAMLISGPHSPFAAIRWLAVRSTARGQGVGTSLVAAALRHFGEGVDVVVDTFGADHPAGLPARRMYTSCGFRAEEDLPPGPEGGSRQRLRRPARSIIT